MATERYITGPSSEYETICGEGFTLRIRDGVMRALEAQVREGFNTSPGPGLEVGGLLVGRAPGDGSDLLLESVHTVAIEHQFGRSYQLSEPDIESFRQTISRLQAESRARVIGHFRSHTKGPLEVMFADLAIAALVGIPQPLMLLISASAMEPSQVRVFRKTSEKYTESPALPLARTAAAVPLVPAAQQSAEMTPAPARRAITQAHPDPVREKAAHSSLGKTVLAAGLAAVIALGAFAVWLRPSRPVASTPEPIGLTLVRTGEALTLRWDPRSAPVRNATSGVLTIRDGEYQRRMEFNQEQLRSASIVYAPETPTVEFQLTVYRDQNVSSGETVLFVSALPPAAHRAEQEETAHRRTGENEKPRARPPDHRESRPPGKEKRPLILPPRTPGVSPPQTLPELTAVIAPSPRIAQGLDLLLPGQTGLPIPGPRMDAAPPLVSYVAPVPVRKVMPTVPVGVRAMVQDTVSIEVRVTIDAEGKVTNATPLSASSPGQKVLSARAVQAAMLWRFEPARRNGQPVASETTLKFDFARR